MIADIVFWVLLSMFVALIFAPFLFSRKLEDVPAATPRRAADLARAYLVVHLDLKRSPPTVLFVTTYSSSAKDLTMTGLHEARADLYMCEAPTLEEALEHLRYIQPQYFPWATEFMTRQR